MRSCASATFRMRYSNWASRLEGLNKQFGTAILAGEDVYSHGQSRFQFKAVGSVTAKGMTRKPASSSSSEHWHNAGVRPVGPFPRSAGTALSLAFE
jgi:hypothetical protein